MVMWGEAYASPTGLRKLIYCTVCFCPAYRADVARVQLERAAEGRKWRVRHQLGAVSNVQEGHLEPDGYLVDIAI